MFWFLLFQVPVHRPGQTRKSSMRATILVSTDIMWLLLSTSLRDVLWLDPAPQEMFVFLARAFILPPPPLSGFPCKPQPLQNPNLWVEPVHGDPQGSTQTHAHTSEPFARPVWKTWPKWSQTFTGSWLSLGGHRHFPDADHSNEY